MTSPNSQRTLLGLAVVAALIPLSATAQQVIRIQNAGNREIPLEANSSVQIDAAGNLVAQCALTGGVCAALSSGGQTGSPTATLTRTDTLNPVPAGNAITLSWTSTNADVCAGTASVDNPGTTSWVGAKATAGAAASVVLPAEGEYELGLRCYNTVGASTEQTIDVTVTASSGGPGGVDACTSEIAGDPLVQPAGMTRVNRIWGGLGGAFSAPNGSQLGLYPISPPGPIFLGADKFTYTVVPFVPLPNQNVQLTFDHAQSNSGYGYTNPRVTNGGMFIAISPCPGDLRAIGSSTTDQFTSSKCRVFNATGSIIYSTLAGPGTVCRLQPGVNYYYTISPVDPSNGIQQGEETCGTTLAGCDVQATSRTL